MSITKIRLARLEAGLKQWEVAKAIGVSEAQLSKWETNRQQAPDEMVKKIQAVVHRHVRVNVQGAEL